MDTSILLKCAHLTRQKLSEQLQENNITYRQWSILKEIYAHQPVKAKKVVRNINSDKATVSIILKSLTQKGYIERVVTEEDARAKEIRLTPKAVTLCEEIQKVEDQFTQDWLEGISKTEMKQLLATVEKLHRNLERMR